MQGCRAHRHPNATGSIQLSSIVGLIATAFQVCKCRIELLGGLQHMCLEIPSWMTKLKMDIGHHCS